MPRRRWVAIRLFRLFIGFRHPPKRLFRNANIHTHTHTETLPKKISKPENGEEEKNKLASNRKASELNKNKKKY